MIENSIREMNEYNVFLDSAHSVKKALLDNDGFEASEYEIRRVMRDAIQMKFKKVIPISVHGNSEKNLLLRQRYALKLISLLQ